MIVLDKSKIILGNNINICKKIEDNSVDMILTSPPYDTLRKYKTKNIKELKKLWNYEKFKKLAKELTRILKPGGVIVWIVGDATIKGSESCSSFKQALYFKERCKLNLHDTMIYNKQNWIPLSHNRYEQSFEYMFVFSKGKPKTFNPIKIPTKNPGKKINRKNAKTEEQAVRGREEITIIKNEKMKNNVWTYTIGQKTFSTIHPAVFPYQLAVDHIKSWSNEGDIILDPFSGSGTTVFAAINNNRIGIGIEISEEYFKESLKNVFNY